MFGTNQHYNFEHNRHTQQIIHKGKPQKRYKRNHLLSNHNHLQLVLLCKLLIVSLQDLDNYQQLDLYNSTIRIHLNNYSCYYLCLRQYHLYQLLN